MYLCQSHKMFLISMSIKTFFLQFWFELCMKKKHREQKSYIYNNMQCVFISVIKKHCTFFGKHCVIEVWYFYTVCFFFSSKNKFVSLAKKKTVTCLELTLLPLTWASLPSPGPLQSGRRNNIPDHVAKKLPLVALLQLKWLSDLGSDFKES